MTSKEEEIVSLFEGIQKQLNHDWEKFRDQHHNPSNKGASYEQALGNFLTKYYRGVYEIQTQSVIIDENLDVFDVFDTSRGEHEIDLVGLFESARPRIVFDVGEMTYVPLIGTAFLCEVKSKIDSGRLGKDLTKLRKVSKLAKSEQRSFAISQTGTYTTNSQIKCLVYDERSISDERLVDQLIEYQDAWDLLLIVQDDVLFVNSSLPFFDDIRGPADVVGDEFDIDEISFDDAIIEDDSEIDSEQVAKMKSDFKMSIRKDRNFGTLNNGMAWFLVLLSASIPRPLGIDTADTLKNMIEKYQDLTTQNTAQK